jgi:hypothetical protein
VCLADYTLYRLDSNDFWRPKQEIYFLFMLLHQKFIMLCLQMKYVVGAKTLEKHTRLMFCYFCQNIDGSYCLFQCNVFLIIRPMFCAKTLTKQVVWLQNVLPQIMWCLFRLVSLGLVPKHAKKTAYMFHARTLGLFSFNVSCKTIVNTWTMILLCLVQNHWPNFVSERPMFFQMFWHQTSVNASSGGCLVRHGIEISDLWRLLSKSANPVYCVLPYFRA